MECPLAGFGFFGGPGGRSACPCRLGLPLPLGRVRTMKGVWKPVGPLLLLYVAAMTAWVPLGPGLLECTPEGPGRFSLLGHGTHFEEAAPSVRVFLRSGNNVLPGDAVSVTSAHRLSFEAHFPDTVPARSWDVFVLSDADGSLLLENGVFLADATVDTTAALPAVTVPAVGPAAGFHFPFQPRVEETIRNLMWHVPLWFAMFVLAGMAFVASMRQLGATHVRASDENARSASAIAVGLGVAGLITGSIWARFTWGTWWVDDPQLNGALVTTAAYGGYHILRESVDRPAMRARLAAVYNVFAFVLLVILLMIMPRFSESLHPGKGGNPGFNTYDLDASLRWVFYPAVLGWILTALWMQQLVVRMARVRALDNAQPTPPLP